MEGVIREHSSEIKDMEIRMSRNDQYDTYGGKNTEGRVYLFFSHNLPRFDIFLFIIQNVEKNRHKILIFS